MPDDNPREQLCDRYHPQAKMLVCYLPCWPFEAEWCDQCEEVVVYWGSVKTAIWWALVGWYWNGAVTILRNAPFPRSWRTP